MKNSIFLRKKPVSILAASIALALNTNFALAQDQDTVIEEITVLGVTGTGIRGVAPTGSQVLAISREDMIDQPIRSASEVVASLPQGSNLGNIEEGSNTGASGVNLRGLGGNATLILFDGHRLAAQGVTGEFSDPNIIPFSAIERVEVVMDGASAVYGSDAVAGVVNYIYRKDFEGVDLNVRYESNGDFDGKTVEALFGKNFDRGNIMIGFSAQDRESQYRSARGYMSEDLSSYGGIDNRINPTRWTDTVVGSPGAIVVDDTIYGIPEGLTGLDVPTLAQVQALEGIDNVNVYDLAESETYLPEKKVETFFGRIAYELTDTVDLAFTAMRSERDSNRDNSNQVAITVEPSSPYYIPGISPTNSNMTVLYNPELNGVNQMFTSADYINNFYLDLRADVFGDWELNSSIFTGDSKGCARCGPESNNVFRFQYAQDAEDYALLNPYIDGVQEEGVNRLVSYTTQSGAASIDGANIRLEGPVAELPAGTMRVHVGAEQIDTWHYLLLNQSNRNYEGTFVRVRDTENERTVKSVFAESYVPLLADLPGIDLLSLSLAVRKDDYSDFGETTNPKVGLTWEVTEDLSFRGSWGEAFRAPTLTETDPGSFNLSFRNNVVNNTGDDALPISDPSRGTSYIFRRVGNNPDLTPELAEMYSFGFDWSPFSLEGLDISTTYYSVSYENRIENLPNWESAFTSPERYAQYQAFIEPTPQPASCVAGDYSTYHPILAAVALTPGFNQLGSSASDCELVGYMFSGLQNTGTIDQKGIDFNVSYSFDNDLGSWRVGTNVAKILKLDRALLSSDPQVTAMDTIGNQVSLRANANLNWMKDAYTGNVRVNYIGSYLNDAPITVNGESLGNSDVPAWITVDAQVSYEPQVSSGVLSGTRFSLGFKNLLDRDPPIVLSGVLDYGFDSGQHNPYGRIMSLELNKSF